MNSLTKALIEGLIDENESFNEKIVGMFGGGFKPPTIGHLEVVKKALSDYPEMDELIVLVGSGVRDSISQEESLAIWDIYKKYLPSKVKIMASPKNKAPIGAIYSYARKNPNEKIYWFLGEREGNEGDAKDIVKRTKSLRKLAYQNVKVKKIVTGGAVSGTKARQAVLNKDKEAFLQYIPDIPEADKIWDILTGVVKEQYLQERIAYDAETRMQTRFLMKQFLKNLGTRVESDTEGALVGKEYELVYKFIPSKTNLGFLPFKITGSTGPKDIEIVIQYQPKELTKEYYSELSAEIRNTVRHELEHLAQYRTDKGVKPRGNQDDLPDVEYLTLDYEIPGHIQGLRTKAKAKKISLQQAIEDLFNSAEYDLDLDEEDFVRETWMNWLETNMPDVSLTKIKEDKMSSINLDQKKSTYSKEYLKILNRFPETLQREIIDERPKGDQADIDELKGWRLNKKTPYNISLNKLLKNPENLDSISRTPKEVVNKINLNWGTKVKPGTVYDQNPGRYFEYATKFSGDTAKPSMMVNGVIMWGVGRFIAALLRGDKTMKVWDIQDSVNEYLDQQDVQDLDRLADTELNPIDVDLSGNHFFDRLNDPRNTPEISYLELENFFTKLGDNRKEFIDFLNKYKSIVATDNETNINIPFMKMANKAIAKTIMRKRNFKTPNEKIELHEKDPKKGTGKKPKGSGRRLYTDENPKDTVKIKFSTRQDIVDTLNKKSFKSKSHARQSQVINLIHQRVRAAYGRAKKPEVKKRLKSALDYITKRKEASKAKTQRLKKQKTNEGLIKENLTPQITSLTQYMGNNGLNLRPYPKVKFINDDAKNANDLLGRTAYYSPNEQLIALYTMGRHPKDILRSYAHELIHHHQNLSGTLNHTPTTNTNEDGNLEQIEREAYEEGNILFRNWEDSLKNN